MPQLTAPTRPNRASRSRKLQPPPRKFYAIMCGLGTAFGVVVLSANLIRFWLDERVRPWPTTSARLLSVEIARDEIGVLSGRYANIPLRERRFHVRYSYSVAGSSYVGTEIGARGAIARVGGGSNRYMVGQSVIAHYNPADPTEAVIEAPFPAAALLGMVAGAALLGIAWHTYRISTRLRPRDSGARDA
jgi:hypothetical protein